MKIMVIPCAQLYSEEETQQLCEVPSPQGLHRDAAGFTQVPWLLKGCSVGGSGSDPGSTRIPLGTIRERTTRDQAGDGAVRQRLVPQALGDGNDDALGLCLLLAALSTQLVS